MLSLLLFSSLVGNRVGGYLWIAGFALMVGVNAILWFYFRGSRDVVLKRKAMKWGAILAGAVMIVLFGLTNLFLPLIFGPFIVLILYLNYRNTHFCASCGRKTYNHEWWTKIEFCPKCGTRFTDGNDLR